VSAGLATLALALLCALGFAWLTALLSLALWPLCARALRGRHPLVRARAAFAFALAPVVVPLVLLALCLAPGVASWLGLHEDHCLHHAEHAHLCVAHPTLALSVPLAGLLGLAGVAIVAAVVQGGRRLARSQRELAALPPRPADAFAPDVRLVRSTRPFSVTFGLWRPQIWLSTALADVLPQRQLDAVLAHERAHARRRDALRRLLAGVAALVHWPSLRRTLQAELALASEQACDEAAARHVGDRLAVAETILAVERLLARSRAPEHVALASFAGSAVESRVRSLVAGAPPEPARGSLWWLAPAAIAVAVVLIDPLHHATEHVLGLVLRIL
jgi:Zn-dependent protease with chaperone function